MNLSIFFIAIGLVICVLIVIIFILSEDKEKKARKMKKERQAITEEKLKEMEAKGQERVIKLEHLTAKLRQEIVEIQKANNNSLKDLALEKEKVSKLQEKIKQERTWYTQEKQSIDKRTREWQDIKNELKTAQETLAQEHFKILALERESKDLKAQLREAQEKCGNLESELKQWQAKDEVNRREMVRFKSENSELKAAKEDSNWIAKTEYVRLKQLLESKESQLKKPRGE